MAIDRDDALRKAEKLLRQGRLDGAIAEYEHVVEAFPDDIATASALGDLYGRAGKAPQAVAQFMRLGDHFLKEGVQTKAAASYRKVLKLDPVTKAPCCSSSRPVRIRACWPTPRPISRPPSTSARLAATRTGPTRCHPPGRARSERLRGPSPRRLHPRCAPARWSPPTCWTSRGSSTRARDERSGRAERGSREAGSRRDRVGLSLARAALGARRGRAGQRSCRTPGSQGSGAPPHRRQVPAQARRS